MSTPPFISAFPTNSDVYTVPAGQLLQPASVTALFDGSGAAGSFKPCLTIRSATGLVVSRTFPDASVAVGDSARVTFAPFLRAGTSSSATTAAPTGRGQTAIPYGNSAVGSQYVNWTTASVSDATVLYIDGTNANRFRINQTGMWLVWAQLTPVTAGQALTGHTLLFLESYRDDTVLQGPFSAANGDIYVPGGATDFKIGSIDAYSFVNVNLSNKLPYYIKLGLIAADVFAISSVTLSLARIGDLV